VEEQEFRHILQPGPERNLLGILRRPGRPRPAQPGELGVWSFLRPDPLDKYARNPNENICYVQCAGSSVAASATPGRPRTPAPVGTSDRIRDVTSLGRMWENLMETYPPARRNQWRVGLTEPLRRRRSGKMQLSICNVKGYVLRLWALFPRTSLVSAYWRARMRLQPGPGSGCNAPPG